MHLLLTCQNRKVSRYARNARAHRGIGEENELLQDLQKVALFVPRLFVKQEQQLLEGMDILGLQHFGTAELALNGLDRYG